MVNKEQRSKKSIAAEVIYSEKANKIYAYILEIRKELINTKGKEINSSELLKKIDLLGEELMRQDIRVATATGLIEKHPYPVDWEVEKQRLEEINKEIENRVNSENFPHKTMNQETNHKEIPKLSKEVIDLIKNFPNYYDYDHNKILIAGELIWIDGPLVPNPALTEVQKKRDWEKNNKWRIKRKIQKIWVMSRMPTAEYLCKRLQKTSMMPIL